MTIEEFNGLSAYDASEALYRCCNAPNWTSKMMTNRPYLNMDELFEKADEFWVNATYRDVMTAFSGHPKIGDKKDLEKKFKKTADWASDEQKGVNLATDEIIESLASHNSAYELKFGYIFIVCATGKSASEMLDILMTRLNNRPDQEYDIAKAEQGKITKIRLQKLLT